MSDIPRAPAGLGKSGRRLWRAIVADVKLRPDELPVLRSACRLEDEIAMLEVALVDAPATVEGSKGQVVTHPLFAEVRQHRLAQARLLRQLGIAEEEPEKHGTARSAAGRRLARTRWDG